MSACYTIRLQKNTGIRSLAVPGIVLHMMLADSLGIRFCMRLKDVGCNGSRRRYSHFCDGDDDVFFRALLIKLMEARIDKLEEGERNKKIKELADSLLCLFAKWN